MVTSPNLALKIWNLSTDPYDSGQLADNWAKVDQHDHSSGKGVQVPTGGIADSAITQSKIAPGVTLPAASVPAGSITTTELADGTVGAIDLATGAVTNSKLGTGSVTSNEILDNTIAAGDVAGAELDRLGLSGGGVVRRSKSIIPTPESRTNVAYGTLTTPDQVSVVLPTDGFIVVAFQGTMQQSNSNTAQAALFLGVNQVKLGPSVQETGITGAVGGQDFVVASYIGGLVVSGTTAPYGGDATTGQILGGTQTALQGPCYIFAAAGTYTVSVQFKASAGSVTAKNRKLWVWTIGF